MTYREYFTMLKNHDWYFNMADDPAAYKAGRINQDKLCAICNKSKSPLPEKMYKAWSDYMFSGEAFGTTELQEPQLTEFINSVS